MKNFLVLSRKESEIRGIEVLEKKQYYQVTEPKNFSPKTIKNKQAILLDYSEPFYFSRDSFTKAPREVLLYQINGKIQPLSIFSRAPYVVYKILEETLSELDITFLAVDSQHFRKDLEFFLSNVVYVFEQYHFVIAVSSLSLVLSSSPLLSLYICDHCFVVFITDGNDIVYIRHFPAEEYSTVSSAQVEAGVLSTMDYYHRFSNKHIEAYIVYGPRRDLAPSLGGLLALEPYWPNIKGVSSETILTYPEYYGAIFAPKEFNLLPEDHKVCISNLNIARKFALFFLIFSFLNTGLWFKFSQKEKHLSQLSRSKEEYLSQELASLSKNLPKNLDNFKYILHLSESFSRQIRVDMLLSWLANSLPNGVKVLSISIENMKNNSSSRYAPQVKNSMNTLTPYVSKIIDLKLSMDGNSVNTQSVFYDVFYLLQRKFTVENSSFVYNASLKRAYYYFILRAREGSNAF